MSVDVRSLALEKIRIIRERAASFSQSYRFDVLLNWSFFSFLKSVVHIDILWFIRYLFIATFFSTNRLSPLGFSSHFPTRFLDFVTGIFGVVQADTRSLRLISHTIGRLDSGIFALGVVIEASRSFRQNGPSWR